MRSVNDYYTFTPNDRQKYGAQRDNGREHRGTDISYSTTPGTAVPALLGGTVHSVVAPSSSHGFGHQTVTSVQFGSKRYHVSYAHGRVAPPVRKGQRFMEVFDVAQGVFINPMPFIKQVLSTGAVASLGSATLLPTQRLVTSASLNRRRTPDRRSAPLSDPLKRGTIGNFVGWRRGERVNGNDVWFQGTSGDWFHSGGLDGGSRTTGLKNLNPAAATATRTVMMHLVGNERREEPMMTSLSDVANDERTARMVLSMLVEPNDPVTGRILSRHGAVETLWLAERDGAVVGLSPVDAQVWKAGQAPFVRRITCEMPTWGPVWYQNDAALPRVRASAWTTWSGWGLHLRPSNKHRQWSYSDSA